jgi:hypothetical protein
MTAKPEIDCPRAAHESGALRELRRLRLGQHGRRLRDAARVARADLGRRVDVPDRQGAALPRARPNNWKVIQDNLNESDHLRDVHTESNTTIRESYEDTQLGFRSRGFTDV